MSFLTQDSRSARPAGRVGGTPATYMDANASEAPRPEAEAAMLMALRVAGNPSSIHAAGRAARRILEDARDAVARQFGGNSAELVFTSGGTEADALAVHALGPAVGRRVIVGATEHDAIRAAAPDAEIAPVDGNGVVDLEALARLLEGPPALVCLMLANNETGVLHPIAAAAVLCRARGALLHVDAIQAAGRMKLDFAALGASSLALSAHKMGGPMGAGALLLAPDMPLRAQLAGGGQERGRRGGTPALPAIAGFAAACVAPSALTIFRDRIAAAARDCGAQEIGAGAPRLGNTLCLALPGVRAETQVIAMDLAGVQVSAGAACSSGKVGRSHVLDAMGLGPLAGEAIRVSLPWNVTDADVDACIAAYRGMAARLRRETAA